MSAVKKNEAGLLDADGPDTVRLSVAEAEQLGKAALARVGFDNDEAQIIIDQLVDNALCGYKFAGLPRIVAIATNLKTRAARKPIRVVHETAVSAQIDGGNNVGYLAAFRGAQMAIEKSRATGLSIVGVNNSYYSGRNAYYVELMVKAGLVAIHTAAAEPKVFSPGAKKPALGTNPMAFGFPSLGGPVVFDMGTASIMGGELLLHSILGQQLPEGLAFDNEGRPTRDPKVAMHGGGVIPFGGHKGYGLSFTVQALGLLAGSALTRGEVRDYGFLFIAINPELLVPGGRFPAQMSRMVEEIKNMPRQDGVAEIRVPSERASRERERRRREGIVLERSVIATIEAL
jgi:LDH2 family malate/lactate/ureidoglycolate dehydrogenase